MSATYIAKGKAKKFLHRLFESDSKDKNQSSNSDLPSNPQASSGAQRYSTLQFSSTGQDLVQSFNALALSGSHQHHSNPDFIGGFRPDYISSSANGAGPLNQPAIRIFTPTNIPADPGPLPRPPVVPSSYYTQTTPQSLTMQMALRPPIEQTSSSSQALSSRPHSTSSPLIPSSNAIPYRPALTLSSSLPATPPTKPRRPRASSSPTTSVGPVLTRQCAGVTKAGKQCTRQVKFGPALSQLYSNEVDSATIERFCFQHTKELLGPSGYYSRKNGEWIKFDDWIPQYLQTDTQVALRTEMEKSRSQSDKYGYIYTYEIREPNTLEMIKLKVGRTVNLVKRIDQWAKQCSSKELILRGWHPGTVEPDQEGNEGSLMKGRVKAGEKGAWCHRLERLIHLELADLAATGVYLDPAWPNIKPPIEITRINAINGVQPCSDCGSTHKEIFEFRRIKKGRYKGKEWEYVVMPVIEKWGNFVDNFV